MDRKVVILATREGLGTVLPQDRRFGLEMFDRLLHGTEGLERKPSIICCYTEGVKLACEGSPVVPALKLIEGMGVRILLCKTCLDYFGLLERVAVGEVTGMNRILEALMDADHVITV